MNGPTATHGLRSGILLQGGTYRIDEQLTVDSGMGELYRATHVSSGTPRAIKRLKQIATSSDIAAQDLELFEAEARRLAVLSHTGIPRVYESFSEQGHFFFCMDWVEGRNAEQILEQEGNWSVERCLDVAAQLADVLAYLHHNEPPLIHRDVKPANLMVSDSQHLTLIDFGIARTGERQIQGRRDTIAFGTEDYAPPEQLDPSIARTTPRSDIFAFGWTLAHLLSGFTPSSERLGKDQERLQRLLYERVPVERRWFADVLVRCVAHNPEERYADGGELAHQLRHAGRSAAMHRSQLEFLEAACQVCQLGVPTGRHFCPACGTPIPVSRSARRAHGQRVEATLRPPQTEDIAGYAKALEERNVLPPMLAELSSLVAKLDCTGDFEHLVSEARLRFTPLPHQVEAAIDVLRHKRGRALLADEVGLGKTIEALIVLEEYRQRGLVKRVLILTPPTLMGQWRDEMVEKLGINARDIYQIDPDSSVQSVRRQIAAHDFAIGDIQALKYKKREPIFKELAFDLVIVDEVHLILSTARNKVRPGKPLRGYQLIENIEKKFVLLLSATPVQNTIVDLFELVNLTRPGQLMRWDDFKDRFIERIDTRRDGSKFPVIRGGLDLRNLLRKVIVRHSRDEVMTTGVFPRREARLIKIELAPDERALYDELRDRLAQYVRQRRMTPSWCLDLADSLGAHPHAFRERVRRLGDFADLAERAREMAEPTKFRHLVQAVDELVRRDGRKVLVFSRFPAARDRIHAAVSRHHRTFLFHKGITDTERVNVLRRFQHDADVLVVDDSAAVGLNLQFCDVVVNYDLPWNPFLIEQRVGRVQRIGQRRESVWIVNFQVPDTIDEIKLDMCQARLQMFEGVFGQAPSIMGALNEEDFDLATVLQQIYLERDAQKVRQRARRLAESLQGARERVSREERRAHEVFDEIEWS